MALPQHHCGNATARDQEGAGAPHPPSPTPAVRSRLPSDRVGGGRRGPLRAQLGPPPVTPPAQDGPSALTESFNELGEDPGVAFHEAPLPGIARHGPATRRPSPPLAPAAPRTSCRRPLISANPPPSSSTPRHPAYFPTASGRRHLQRHRAREDALAARETAKVFPGCAGPVADSEGAGIQSVGGGNIRDPRQSGAGAGRRNGAGRRKRGGTRSREPDLEAPAAVAVELERSPPIRPPPVVDPPRGAGLLPGAPRVRRVGGGAQVRKGGRPARGPLCGLSGPRDARAVSGPPCPSRRISVLQAGADASPDLRSPALRSVPCPLLHGHPRPAGPGCSRGWALPEQLLLVLA